MSAWALTRTHLSVVAALIVNQEQGRITNHPEHYEDIFELIRDANSANLDYRYEDRYPEDERGGLSTLTPLPYHRAMARVRSMTLGALIKTLDCAEYQCCDQEVWKDSKADRLIEQAREVLISVMPDYQAGPWGLEDDEDDAEIPIEARERGWAHER